MRAFIKSWVGVTLTLIVAACKGESELTGSIALVDATTPTPTPTPTPVPGPKHIFVTAATHDGRFGINATSAMIVADIFCQADTNRTGTGVYQALLASSARNTSTNWVLKASTEYRRLSDDAIIGTTNVSKTFDFPLGNYLGSYTDPTSTYGVYVWTGMDNTMNPYYTCNDWTDKSYNYGNYGYTSQYSSNSFSYGYNYCNQQKRIVCVEK